MLSKKMAFSLTSLITILALAFAVMPAMAATFSVSLDMKGDVSAVAGLQVVHPIANDPFATELAVKVEFGELAKLKGTSVFATTYGKDSKRKAIPTVTADPEDKAAIAVTLKIPLRKEKDEMTVRLRIKAGAIAPANPLSSNTSAELDTTVTLLIGADVGGPMVYSMERVGVNFRQLKTPEINPTDNPKVQVRVTLSEYPKTFTTSHISASGATVSKVEALVPEDARGSFADFLISDEGMDALGGEFDNLPRKRELHDEIPDGTTNPRNAADDADLAVYLDATTAAPILPQRFAPLAADDSPELRAAKVAARDKYGGIHRAINEGDYNYDMLSIRVESAAIGVPYTVTSKAKLELPNFPNDVVDAAATPVVKKTKPAKPGEKIGAKLVSSVAVSDNAGAAIADGIAVVPGVYLAKDTNVASAPEVPKLLDFRTGNPTEANSPWRNAVEKYAVLLHEYVTYKNKLERWKAYEKAVAAEMMKDDEERAEFYDDKVSAPVNTGVATGVDMRLYPYLVTLTPKYLNKNAIVVTVNEFEDRTSPVSLRYIPPIDADDYVEGVDKLTIPVGATKPAVATTAGIEVMIGSGTVIPKDGYLVVAKSVAGSAVRNPGTATKEPANPPRKPFGLTYNLVAGAGLPNLERLLINGGTIDIVGPKGLVISEIMWGSDASLANSFESQYIELKNTSGAAITAGAADTATEYKLVFYGAGQTPPDMSVAANNIQDRVATVGAHGHWTPAGKGRSGRTGVGESPGDAVAIAPTQSLISMQRIADATSTTGLSEDGTDPMSWGEHAAPGLNFDPNVEGERIGSPGRAPTTYPTAPTPPTVTPPTPPVDAAVADDIDITEIMVDTDSGRLPQWIELTSVATGEVSLDGWSMVIDNAIDADVLGGGNAITIDLSTITLDVSAHAGNEGKGQSALVVAWEAQRSSDNISTARIVDVGKQLGQTRRYQLLSYNGFRITLVPPDQEAIAAFGDRVGNLHEDWELPMDGRSSIIRREMDAAGMELEGTDANGWVLASSTSLITAKPSYYGDDEDQGTPGQDAGGPLPVELSHFRPARDKATGAVVITWATQSELNNAGFFIKRSNQRNGQFQVVNPTMIPGAGTTSEKQFYTYTDTTAQPNVVYYYQIEDVSLDGNRQTLTNGIRLKGHIGAAGKATTLWGELKSSNE